MRPGPTGDEWDRFRQDNAALHAEHRDRINRDHEPRIASNTTRHDVRDTQEKDEMPWPARFIDGVLGAWFERFKGAGAQEAWLMTKSAIRWGILIVFVWLAVDTALWYRKKEDLRSAAAERTSNAAVRTSRAAERGADAQENAAGALEALGTAVEQKDTLAVTDGSSAGEVPAAP